MVLNKLTCQTLYVLKYIEQMGNKPRFSNRMLGVCVYKFQLLSLQPNVKHIFHTFMATTQRVVLTEHGATGCNLIFELSTAVQ